MSRSDISLDDSEITKFTLLLVFVRSTIGFDFFPKDFNPLITESTLFFNKLFLGAIFKGTSPPPPPEGGKGPPEEEPPSEDKSSKSFDILRLGLSSN